MLEHLYGLYSSFSISFCFGEIGNHGNTGRLMKVGARINRGALLYF